MINLFPKEEQNKTPQAFFEFESPDQKVYKDYLEQIRRREFAMNAATMVCTEGGDLLRTANCIYNWLYEGGQ